VLILQKQNIDNPYLLIYMEMGYFLSILVLFFA